MILNYRIFGREDSIVEFERELLDILIRLVGKEEMTAHEIHFCIHEAILNILQHTYKWNLNQPIEVKIVVSGSDETNDKTLEISIKDLGPAIDSPLIRPEDRQIPDEKTRLIHDQQDYGRVLYQTRRRNGNVTYMKKLLSPTQEKVIDVVR
jgi:anti-sigma regulatory factor (Ser/Thr protein kinase)